MLEVTWRTLYMDRYIARYRVLRDRMNSGSAFPDSLPVSYDLANHFAEDQSGGAFLKSLIRRAIHSERVIFYVGCALGAFIAGCLF